MKIKDKWLKITKRGAMIALSICSAAVLTGCPWDDDDDNTPPVPEYSTWELTIDIPGEGSVTETIALPIDDLLAAGDGTYDFDDGTASISLTISGSTIFAYIFDSSDGSELTLNGNITGSTSMSGTFEIFVPNEGTFTGTWSAIRV